MTAMGHSTTVMRKDLVVGSDETSTLIVSDGSRGGFECVPYPAKFYAKRTLGTCKRMFAVERNEDSQVPSLKS
jgi:hypothetical protein